jgi:ABC-type glutathione transport system ATPase component
MAMLLVSHTPEVQASLADRLLVMAAGEVIERGDLRQLCKYPADARTRKLLERNSKARREKDCKAEGRIECQPV